MTKKQGLALPAGVYKVFWKRGGWSWAAIGEVVNVIRGMDHYRERMKTGFSKPCFDRYIMAINWSGGSRYGSRMWRKIAKVERAPLAKMKGER